MGKTRTFLRAFSFRLWLRIAGGIILLILGVVLGPLPGPGLVVFLAGLFVLGFTVDDVVDICRRVIPGFDEEKANSILRKPYLRPFRRLQWRSLIRRGSEKQGGQSDRAD